MRFYIIVPFLLVSFSTCKKHVHPASQIKVIGGLFASPGMFPAVSLLLYSTHGGVNSGCTASFVSSTVMITAAHCLKNIDVHAPCVGLMNIDVIEGRLRDHTCAQLRYRARKIFRNVAFVGAIYPDPFDVALVQFAQPLIDANRVLVIAHEQPRIDQRVTLVGYGPTASHHSGTGRKFYGSNTISSLATDAQGIIFKGRDNDEGAPAGKQVSMGGGDSGGPLLTPWRAFDAKGDKSFLQQNQAIIGVASSGREGNWFVDALSDASSLFSASNERFLATAMESEGFEIEGTWLIARVLKKVDPGGDNRCARLQGQQIVRAIHALGDQKRYVDLHLLNQLQHRSGRTFVTKMNGATEVAEMAFMDHSIVFGLPKVPANDTCRIVDAPAIVARITAHPQILVFKRQHLQYLNELLQELKTKVSKIAVQFVARGGSTDSNEALDEIRGGKLTYGEIYQLKRMREKIVRIQELLVGERRREVLMKRLEGVAVIQKIPPARRFQRLPTAVDGVMAAVERMRAVYRKD